jgi:short subunit dehydrogenase
MATDLLPNKVVFLTGGAQGIGRECALAYAREGAQVVIADIDLPLAEQTAAELAIRGLAIRCDVGDSASVEAAIQQTLQHYARLDAVHNNAGISSPSRPVHETTEAEWDRLQRINLKSVFLTTYQRRPGDHTPPLEDRPGGRGIRQGHPLWLDASGLTAGPLFRSVWKGGRQLRPNPLGDRAIAEVVKRAAQAAGYDPARFSGHSLRAGLVTTAAAAGVDERTIMEQTGHKTTPASPADRDYTIEDLEAVVAQLRVQLKERA